MLYGQTPKWIDWLDRRLPGFGIPNLALYLVGRAAELRGWYSAGLLVGAIFFLRHLVMIRKRDRQRCFDAFLNNHYFGMAVFIGIALDYLFRT